MATQRGCRMLEHGAELGNVKRAPTMMKAPVCPAYQGRTRFQYVWRHWFP